MIDLVRITCIKMLQYNTWRSLPPQVSKREVLLLTTIRNIKYVIALLIELKLEVLCLLQV